MFDGIAIHNALKRHPAHVTVLVEGIAASITSVIVCAGDEVVMPENAMLMLHEPSAVVSGTADDLLSMAAALEKMRAGLIAANWMEGILSWSARDNFLGQVFEKITVCFEVSLVLLDCWLPEMALHWRLQKSRRTITRLQLSVRRLKEVNCRSFVV